ncbi:rho guanine nucleotide exchange factor 35 [Erinaceus europaeus]|uniref:Rho guanine nucleotide exchange factor 35 n=1 Tax=Erinaceus europaeus TaxID=9365 RepID=A0ABM3XS57_ERIEU|nr:rho guanine nucleotide exchange factor 35 [Erinaceus europaeus]
MAAEEPQPAGASTSIPARAEFHVNPKTLLRSSQSPALRHEAQDPPSEPSRGLSPLETRPSDFQDVSDCVAESMPSFPKEASTEVETHQENLGTEACDTPECQEAGSPSLVSRQSTARTLMFPELWMEQDPLGGLEVQLTSELTPLTLVSDQDEDEGGGGREEGEGEVVAASPDPSAQTILDPSQEGQPDGTHQPRDPEGASVRAGFEQPWIGGQESQEQEEAWGLQEQRQVEARLQGEGTSGGDVCAGGLVREEEGGHRLEGEQRQEVKQEQDGEVLVNLEGERFSGKVDSVCEDGKGPRGGQKRAWWELHRRRSKT